jgi:hypothetical protein
VTILAVLQEILAKVHYLETTASTSSSTVAKIREEQFGMRQNK